MFCHLIYVFLFCSRVNVAAAVNVLNTTSKYIYRIRPNLNMIV